MRREAKIELDAGVRTFATGVLADLIAVLRRSHSGDLPAITGEESAIASDLEAWCRFTGNSLIGSTIEPGGTRAWAHLSSTCSKVFTAGYRVAGADDS